MNWGLLVKRLFGISILVWLAGIPLSFWWSSTQPGTMSLGGGRENDGYQWAEFWFVWLFMPFWAFAAAVGLFIVGGIVLSATALMRGPRKPTQEERIEKLEEDIEEMDDQLKELRGDMV